jgi:2,4-didehydro-3-deoxy-L-rhamnonate hydrolase
MSDTGATPFGIGTFSREPNVRFPALVVGELGIDLRTSLGAEVRTGDLFAAWDELLPMLRRLAGEVAKLGEQVGGWRPLPPVDPPGQIFCAGANYNDHVREIVRTMAATAGGGDRSDRELRAEAEETLARHRRGRPFVFSTPHSALSGAEDDIVLWGPGSSHDWELELAVVIGRGGRDITVEQAMDHVAGYTVCNDVSTRDVMVREDIALTDFLLTKGRPTFLPTGPLVVPAEFVADYRKLELRLSVNGNLMQHATADDMIFGIEQLVAYVSSISELLPGDLLLTGSPAGNAGHHDFSWLSPGDEIVAEIPGIGRQRNLCVADPRARA